MLSARSSWDLTANPLAALLAERRGRGARIIDLTLSNPTRAGFPPLTEAAELLASRAGAPYRPEPLGLPAARQAVCRYLADHGGTCAPDQVILTASTSEAYSFLFKVLADPGDEVLVPRPSYPLFEYLAGLEGVHTVPYPLRYDGSRWALDLDRLAAALGPRARALVLVSPNNPTGSFLREEERTVLVELARELGLALIVDEVFADYLLDGPAPDCAFAGSAEVLTFSLSGLSKVLALPQAKLSWMAVQGPAGQRRQALDRLEVVADTFLSVGTAVQEALPGLLACRHQAQAPVQARLEANLHGLRQRVTQGAEVLRCEAGWYAVLRVAADEERLALTLLEEDGVLVHPGYFFDFQVEGYLVLSLLSPDFAEGVDRLCRRLGEYCPPAP